MLIYDFTVQRIDCLPRSLNDFRGQVLLIVNVASQCGFTGQYQGLETLYRQFKDRGFAVLGFPCNQFGGQEPGTAAEIVEFCSRTYQVTFPLFAKLNVNGPDADPLYQFLKSSRPGILGTEGIKWNFTKFLIDRAGRPIRRYAPTESPEGIAPAIEEELSKVEG